MAENTEKAELKQINLDDVSLPTGEASVLDPTDNPWEFGPPPPKGDYRAKLILGSNGVQMGLDDARDESTLYYLIDIEGRIVSDDPEHNDIPFFERVSTKMGRGKRMSRAAGMVMKLFGKLPKTEGVTPLMVSKWLTKLLQQEPVVWVHLDWRASYKITDRNGKETWKNYATTMENFPPDGKGGHKHMFTADVGGGRREEIKAQLNVVHWYDKGEVPKQGAVKGAAAPVTPAAAATPAVAPIVVEEKKQDSDGLEDLLDSDL